MSKSVRMILHQISSLAVESCATIGVGIAKTILDYTTVSKVTKIVTALLAGITFVYSGGLNLGKVGRKIHPACKADDDVDSIESPEEDNAANGDEFCVKNFPNSNRMSIASLSPNDCQILSQQPLESVLQFNQASIIVTPDKLSTRDEPKTNL